MNRAKNGITSIFVSMFILGILFLIVGSITTYNQFIKNKTYVAVEATFTDTAAFEDSDGFTSYRLVYDYVVDGKKYKITTDYGTSNIPKLGMHKTIKYNPLNPSEAIIPGFGSNWWLFIIGLPFTIIPIGIWISIRKKDDESISEEQRQVKNLRSQNIIMGIVFLSAGILSYFAICSSSDSLFPINDVGLIILTPIFPIVLGILMLFAGLFFSDKKIIDSTAKAGQVSVNIINTAEPYIYLGKTIKTLIASFFFSLFFLWFLIRSTDNVTLIISLICSSLGIFVFIKNIIPVIRFIKLRAKK